jgi:cytochrome c peroxidase
LLTRDDGFGSPGIAQRPTEGGSILQGLFDHSTAVTRRIAPSNLTAQYAPSLFWDGRAKGEFRDPVTGSVVIKANGALESQALVPIMSSIEMAHPEQTWAQVVARLQKARPLALASNLPGDLQQALAARPDYPQLFAAAFGDPEITATRIAFALASYQRTLVPDQTPYDRYVAGEADALTANQKKGLDYFRQFSCAECHTPPLFTDHSFRNVGVRPHGEDPGREAITGEPGDRGRFKVPSLRNVGLRPRLTHNGRFDAINATMRLYRWPSRDPNIDPLLRRGRDVNHRANDQTPMMDFLKHALTDPRVAKETPPFDRPTLRSEREDPSAR